MNTLFKDEQVKKGNNSSVREWLAIFSLALGAFASVTSEFLPVGVLPEVARSFSITDGNAGLMVTLPGILAAMAAPSILLLSGHTDRRYILFILSAILLMSGLLSAWSPNYWIMLLSRALTGISLGAFWTMGLAVAVQLAPANKTHKAVAVVFAGVTAAMIIGVPLGTIISENFSWRVAFIVTSLIAAMALVIQILALPAIPATKSMHFSSLTRVIKISNSRKSMLMITLVFVAHFGTYTYVAPLLQHTGIATSSITWILLGYGMTGFISNFLFSYFIDKHLKGSLLVAKLLLLIPMLILPWLILFPSFEILLVLIWGAAWGALPLSLNTWNRTVSGPDTEASSAIFTFIGQVAIAIGSGLGGLSTDYFGITTTFMGGAAVILISVFLLIAHNRVTEIK